MVDKDNVLHIESSSLSYTRTGRGRYSGRFDVDASELGLPPGVFPREIHVRSVRTGNVARYVAGIQHPQAGRPYWPAKDCRYANRTRGLVVWND
jgi:hypothetical protein